MTKVDLSADISNVAKQRGTGPNTPEQILIDSYVSIDEMGKWLLPEAHIVD